MVATLVLSVGEDQIGQPAEGQPRGQPVPTVEEGVLGKLDKRPSIVTLRQKHDDGTLHVHASRLPLKSESISTLLDGIQKNLKLDWGKAGGWNNPGGSAWSWLGHGRQREPFTKLA